jgi:hypothetical protein
MNFIQQAAMSLGIGILKMALPMITQELKELMIISVAKWKAYAETTPYDWDNLVCKALETLLGLGDEVLLTVEDKGPDDGFAKVGP